MQTLLTIALFGTALSVAVRSTWSPCGRSMLSTITPIGERGRGAGYGTTVAWFVAGALAGGACLGAAMAAPAALVALAGVPSSGVAGALMAGAAIVAAASDARVGGFRLPFHRRQVNELWLDRFRPWVYGGGFGWQIGVGFATYVMSAGLYLMVVLAALRASPALAVAAGTAFGAVRGLAVLLGRRLTDTARLRLFHRRFDAAEPAVRSVVTGWEVVVAVAALGALWPPALGALVVPVAIVAARVLRRRGVGRRGVGRPAPVPTRA